MTVYIVTRQSKDVSLSMVEIMGVFTGRGAADRRRAELAEKHKVFTRVETFQTLDYLQPEPEPKKTKATAKTKAEKAEGKR
jgi:hypothetical protein